MKSQFIIAIITVAGLAQLVQPARTQSIIAGIEFSPFPFYPGDNSPDLDSTLKGKSVFYDLAKKEIVISFDNPQQPGTRKILRFQRRNQVEPLVTSTFSARADGLYVYRYSVVNAPNAATKLSSRYPRRRMTQGSLLRIPSGW